MSRHDAVDHRSDLTDRLPRQHRRQAAPPGKVFEDRYPTVKTQLTACGVSDRQHTRLGRYFWIGRFEQNATLTVSAFDPRTSASAQRAVGVIDDPESGSVTHEQDNNWRPPSVPDYLREIPRWEKTSAHEEQLFA